MRNQIKIIGSFVGIAAFVAVIQGCGSSSSSPSLGSSLSGLDQLPSASQMLGSSSGSSVSYGVLKNPMPGMNIALQVSGTPPKLKELDTTNVDTYFWNGLVAAINTAGTATSSQANQFWGSVNGGPAGHGGCFMAQSVGESFGRILQSATSQCYMKRMPAAVQGSQLPEARRALSFSRERRIA